MCSENEVLHLLETIDISNSNGPDKISGRMLKQQLQALLLEIQLLSCSTCQFQPKHFLTNGNSPVIPVPKFSDTASPSNKILERYIFKLLSKHLESSQPISYSQWGIQHLCSSIVNKTTTYLLETTHNWFQLLENGKEIGAVFFDFRSAFRLPLCTAMCTTMPRWVQI